MTQKRLLDADPFDRGLALELRSGLLTQPVGRQISVLAIILEEYIPSELVDVVFGTMLIHAARKSSQ